jgi:hypothetical protein
MAELGQIGAIPVGGKAPSGLFSTGVNSNKNVNNAHEEFENTSDSE